MSQGALVTLYTYVSDESLRSEIADFGLNIVTASDTENLSIKDFDYVWIHSQVLLISIVRELSQPLLRKMPKFIFLHMSPFDWLSDKQPYIYQMESRLSSRTTLVISEEIEKIIRNDLRGERILDIKYFRNPAPMEYLLSLPSVIWELHAVWWLGANVWLW